MVMMIKNLMKAKLAAGDLALGGLVRLAHPGSVEAMGYAGLDWVLIDLEHGSIDLETCEVMCMYGRALGVTPIVRIHELDEALIGRVLDIGGMGVLVPRVKTAADAERAARACYYSPRGTRGAGPSRGVEFGAVSGADYYKAANEQVIVLLNIEEADAIDNIFEIAAVEGVHVLSFGPNDLSQSYGVHGDFEHPRMKAAAVRVRDAAKATGVALGIGLAAGTAAQVASKVAEGYRSILVGTDLFYLRRAFAEVVRAARERAT